jgi:hypothetical protein
MSYDPQDHTPSTKQVVAAWVICLGIIGLALATTSGRHEVVPAAIADATNAAVTADPAPLAGVHIPEFAICKAEPAQRSSALESQKRGPMSASENQC